MHAKLHRVRVTSANVNYIGSITIDEDLLSRVGILPLEEVHVINLNNSHRWCTYVLPGERESGCICPNGGAALLCQPGDILIIYAYEELDRENVFRYGHKARVLVTDAHNRPEQFFSQSLKPSGFGQVEFQSLEL